MNRTATTLSLCIVFGLACASCSDGDPVGTPDPSITYLTPTEHLVRASMVLRGMRPSLEELQAVAEDPSWLPGIVDHYLTTPEFGATIRELHDEALLVRIDPLIYPAGFPARGELEGVDVQAINRSLADAPLRLIEHVVMNDLPYSEIVTADYTLADRNVAAVWGFDYEPGGENWQITRQTDGRPLAGILSDSFLFTRHSTTYSNRSRGRANAVSTALLCYDFLSREIELDSVLDLADEEAVAHAVVENPACVSCHQTLDPLASFFAAYSPIYVPAQLRTFPYSFYLPSLQSAFAATEPGYFGRPGNSIADLGHFIAEDPRFSLCAAERFASYLTQTPQSEVSAERAAELQAVFIDSGLSARALARAIVLSDEFRTVAVDTEEETVADGLHKVRPGQLARMFEDLTGYRWHTDLPYDLGNGRIGRVDLMTDSFFGFRVLAGGIDGASVTQPTHTMTATAALVLRGLASRAAPFVVNGDFDEPDPGRRRLLTRVDDTDSDEDQVRAQLADLHLRLYGETLEPSAMDESYELFRAALEHNGGDVRRAWTLTLTGMLQDIRIVYF